MVEENINIKFKANTSQITKILRQLRVLQTRIKNLSKDMTKFNSALKNVGSRFSTVNKKTAGLTKKFQSQGKMIKTTRKAVSRLNQEYRKVNKTTKSGTAASNKMGSSIGLTGFQFGFLGGMALLAGDRLKTFFVDIVRTGVEDLGAMNRAVVQSGINIEGFLGGSLGEFDAVSDRIKGLQDDFGEFTRAEVAQAFEQIGRAVGEEVSVDDIEEITESLLKIARIDKTGGAGLAKTAVDLKRVMTQFGISAAGLDEFLDKMVNTNQQGAIELNQLVSSLGFAGAQAQRFGVDINETLALTGFVFEKSGRKAGAAGRTFGNILDKLASTAVGTNPVLKGLGINILDSAGNFNQFSKIIEESRVVFARLKAEGKGQIFESALLEEFGFDKTAARGFLSLVQATKEELAALVTEVEKQGTADLLTQAIGEGADIKLKTFENSIRNLKGEFAVGLIPAVEAFTAAVKEFTSDKEFIAILKEFGTGIGNTLTAALNVAVPIIKLFTDLLKNNAPVVHALATATVVLGAALLGLGTIFLTLGAFFSLVRIHENLIKRSKDTATATNFAARAYSRLITKVKEVGAEMLKLAKRIGKLGLDGLKGIAKVISKTLIPQFQQLFTTIRGATFAPIINALKGLVARFAVFGAGAGALFGGAFSSASAAIIGGGRALLGVLAKLAGVFFFAGGVAGALFGSAWTIASGAVMGALGWLSNLFVRLALAMGFGGSLSGLGFGLSFTGTSGATMKQGGWLTSVITSIGTKLSIAAAAIGAFFGGIFTAVSGGIMAAGAWIKRIILRLGLLLGIGGGITGITFATAFTATSSLGMTKAGWIARVTAKLGALMGVSGAAVGTAFGVAFGVAAALALVTIILSGIDVMIEAISGGSPLRSITESILGKGKGFSVRDAIGIPQQGTSLFQSATGQGLSPEEAAAQRQRQNDFGQGGLFGTGFKIPGGSNIARPQASLTPSVNNSNNVINNDIVINPNIVFNNSVDFDKEEFIKEINEEMAADLQKKFGGLFTLG